jgi:hypothetical protein
MILEKTLNARIGIIARCDNTELGVMTVDFFRNLMIQNMLQEVVRRKLPARGCEMIDFCVVRFKACRKRIITVPG